MSLKGARSHGSVWFGRQQTRMDHTSLSKLTMVRAATGRVGSSWSAIMVSLAVGAAVSRSARHDDDVESNEQ